MARLLSPEDIGIIAMVLAVTGLGDLVRDFGLSMAAVQAKTISDAERTNLFWANVAISLALFAALLVLAPHLAVVFSDVRLTQVLWLCSSVILFNGACAQFKADLNRNLRFGILGLVEAGSQAIGLCLGILVAYLTGSYMALVVMLLATAISELAMAASFASWRPGAPDLKVSITRFAKFGAGLAGTQLLAYLAKRGDNVVLGYGWGAAAVGLYDRAYSLVMAPVTQILVPLTRVAVPLLGQLRDDDDLLLASLKKVQLCTAICASSAYGLIGGTAGTVIPWLLGESWTDTSIIVQAMVFGGVFRTFAQVPYWIFIVKGRTGSQFLFHLFAQPFIISAIIIGAIWGGFGIALSLSVSYLLVWLAQMAWVQKVTGVKVGEITLCGFICFIVFFIPMYIIPVAVIRVFGDGFFAISIASEILYFILAATFWPASRSVLGEVVAVAFKRNKQGKEQA
ncbi:O-antigen/teichoic acid export membrane protein [Devosia sp. 2618]